MRSRPLCTLQRGEEKFDEIKKERGIMRQIAMDLFYGVGGLSGTEIGEMMGDRL